MRTTLSLDDDVAALLAGLARRERVGLKQTVNEALRSGLRVMLARPRRRGAFRTTPVPLGRCYVPDLGDVSGVIALVEGERHK